jgi:hypothetical protein
LGSCSGCDAPRAARDDGRDALRVLRDGMAAKVHWEDDADALAAYMEDKDWLLDVRDDSEADRAFRTRALEILRDLAGGRTDIGTVIQREA